MHGAIVIDSCLCYTWVSEWACKIERDVVFKAYIIIRIIVYYWGKQIQIKQ